MGIGVGILVEVEIRVDVGYSMGISSLILILTLGFDVGYCGHLCKTWIVGEITGFLTVDGGYFGFLNGWVWEYGLGLKLVLGLVVEVDGVFVV